MTDEIKEIVQLFVRLSGDVDEEIKKLPSNSTYHDKTASGVKANSIGLARDWTARGDEVLSCRSRSPPSVFEWQSQNLVDCSTNRPNSPLSLSSADETIPQQDCMVTDSFVNSSIPQCPSDDVLKTIEEEERRLGSQPLARHVTTATNDRVIYRTLCGQPEVAKCLGVTRALFLTKSTRRRTFTTESHQDDLRIGGSLPNGQGGELPKVGKFLEDSVAYHNSRLPDKMSDYEDVWSSPHLKHCQHRCHKGQKILKQPIINFHQASGKKQNVDSAVKQSNSEIFTTSKNRKTPESHSRSESFDNRQIFEIPTKFKGANTELSFKELHETSQQPLESPNKCKRNEDEDDCNEVSSSSANPAKSRNLLKSSHSFVVDTGELGYREVLNSPSNSTTTQPFLKSLTSFDLTKTCVIEDQNANYIPSQSLMENEYVPRNPQLIRKTLEYGRPCDSLPQAARNYSEPAGRDCISGSAARFWQSIRPEIEERFTETAIIKQRSFGGTQTGDGDVKSKKIQVIVRRSLSECSGTRPCNECLRWPTGGRPDATQITNAWKPVQDSWNSSASRLSENHVNTDNSGEKQCDETPLTLSSGFSPATDLRPLTVAEVIDHIAPHLSIRPIKGRSSKDTTPSSLYDNVSCSTSSPQETPTSSTYTDYLPPWDDFSVTKLFDRAQGLSQLKAEMGTEMYVSCLAEMCNSFEGGTAGTAQRYQRPSCEDSQPCQRPSTEGDGQSFQRPSNDEDQLYQMSSTKESVAVPQKVLDSSRDRVRDFLDVDLAICGKHSLRSQENANLETQQAMISRDVTHDTSKIGDMKSIRARFEEPSRIQDIKQVKTQRNEALEIENSTIAKTQGHGSLRLKGRETVHDIPELQGLKRTSGKSTGTSGTQGRRKQRTQKQATLETQSTSPQTLDHPIPTVQHQKLPPNLTSSGPYARQLSLPFHVPAQTTPFARLTPSDVVLDGSVSSLDDTAQILDFPSPCHIRPAIRRRTSCLASIPLSNSQSPLSGINCVSSLRVAERKLSPTPASQSFASKNLLVAQEFQTPIKEEEYFGSGSFLRISSKPGLSTTGNNPLSVRVKDHQGPNRSDPRTTTTRWTEPVCQEWPSLVYAFQAFRPPKINRILVSYLTSLAERRETFFGSLIQTFISCTKRATNRDPRLVCRNVRQFLSGVSNYLTGTNCDSEIGLFLKAFLDEPSSSIYGDDIEATVEVFLQNSVIRPLKSHIFHLLQELHSRSGEEHLLRLGLEKASHQSAAELKLKPDLVHQLEAQMDLIKNHFRRLVEAESALSKLESLRGLASVVFSVITNKTIRPRTSCLVDKVLDQDYLEVMKYLLGQFSLFSTEAEAEFIRDLIRPSFLTEVDVYVIRSLGRAVDELKKLGVAETDVGKDTYNSCRP